MMLGLLTEQGFELSPDGRGSMRVVMPRVLVAGRLQRKLNVWKVALSKGFAQGDFSIDKGGYPFLNERVRVRWPNERARGKKDKDSIWMFSIYLLKNFKGHVLSIHRKTQALSGNPACNPARNSLAKVSLDLLNIIAGYCRGGCRKLEQAGLIPYNAPEDRQFTPQGIANGEPVAITENAATLENCNIPDSDGTEDNIMLPAQAGEHGIFGWAGRVKAEIVDNRIITKHGNVGRTDKGNVLSGVGRCRILCDAFIQLAQVVLERARMNQASPSSIGRAHAQEAENRQEHDEPDNR